RNEIVDDRLQPEADPDRERACDDRQIRNVEAGVGYGDHTRQSGARVTDRRVDRVRDARVHAWLNKNILAQPPLDQSRDEEQRHEYRDADKNADQRDPELTELKAEKQRLDPVTNVGAGKSPLQHQYGNSSESDAERQHRFRKPAELFAARGIKAQLFFEQDADLAARRGAAARVGANGKVEKRRHHSDNARHHHLLRQEAAKSDVAEKPRQDYRACRQPKREFKPG